MSGEPFRKRSKEGAILSPRVRREEWGKRGHKLTCGRKIRTFQEGFNPWLEHIWHTSQTGLIRDCQRRRSHGQGLTGVSETMSQADNNSGLQIQPTQTRAPWEASLHAPLRVRRAWTGLHSSFCSLDCNADNAAKADEACAPDTGKTLGHEILERRRGYVSSSLLSIQLGDSMAQ